MKTEKNILVAFILNFSFAIFEFFGGMYTSSVAILSDAVHDMGDAISIGLSYFLERKSRQKPDEKYTFGYVRYSVLGSIITLCILFVGSVLVISNAVQRLFSPTEINYDGMLLFAIVGVTVNFFAAFLTRKGDSLNQKAINLHMLEDVCGWAVVCIGAALMKITDFAFIDPILSIGVSIFILTNVLKNFKDILAILLEKVPQNIDLDEIRTHVECIDGILHVHHMHIWSMDGQHGYATMHVITEKEPHEIKKEIRKELRKHGILHVTLELESQTEFCDDTSCKILPETMYSHHH